jgi:hypothetical protein
MMRASVQVAVIFLTGRLLVIILIKLRRVIVVLNESTLVSVHELLIMLRDSFPATLDKILEDMDLSDEGFVDLMVELQSAIK